MIGRYERKIRRRDKAAILNPKPLTEKKVKPELRTAEPEPEPQSDAAVLPDEWWENHRLQKRGLPPPHPHPRGQAGPSRPKTQDDDGIDMGTRGKWIGTVGETKKKEKERASKGGIPGWNVIRNYKPSIPIAEGRITVCPSSRASKWAVTDGS